jgi:hypothetical protein
LGYNEFLEIERLQRFFSFDLSVKNCIIYQPEVANISWLICRSLVKGFSGINPGFYPLKIIAEYENYMLFLIALNSGCCYNRWYSKTG